MKRRGGTKTSATARQRAWWLSVRFREMGRRNCQRLNAQRRTGPKCEATKRSDGEPCQNPPLANGSGRCRLHGGRSPAGKQWHVVQFPPVDTAKFTRKLADVQKRARKLSKRIADMSPDQRARYAAWQRSHQPGSPGARSAARYMADQARAIREIIEQPDAPGAHDAELAEIDEILVELKRQHAAASEQTAAHHIGDIFS